MSNVSLLTILALLLCTICCCAVDLDPIGHGQLSCDFVERTSGCHQPDMVRAPDAGFCCSDVRGRTTHGQTFTDSGEGEGQVHLSADHCEASCCQSPSCMAWQWKEGEGCWGHVAMYSSRCDRNASSKGWVGGRLRVGSAHADKYLMLLMRSLTGVLYRSPLVSSMPGNELLPPDQQRLALGLAWPHLGVTMVGMARLENLHTALVTCEKEGIQGSFLEAGVWRGGASIFAAGVIKKYGMQRDVWVCDSFEGFPTNPWDLDFKWGTDNLKFCEVLLLLTTWRLQGLSVTACAHLCCSLQYQVLTLRMHGMH